MAKKKTEEKNNNIMMWTVVIALALGFLGGYFIARTKYKAQITIISTMVAEKAAEVDALKAGNNRIIMVNGEMMMEKDSGITRMENDIEMSNGTRVTIDGKVEDKTGATSMMKDGDSMMMNGETVSNMMAK